MGRTDKPVAAGAVGRRDGRPWPRLLAALATPLLALTTDPAAAFWLHPRPGLGAALRLAAEVHPGLGAALRRLLRRAARLRGARAARGTRRHRSGWSSRAACLGAGAHFANVLPDLADDARTGVRGLPHLLGAAGSRLAAAGLLLAATVTLVLGPPGPPSWVGWSAVAAAVAVPAIGWYAGRAATRRDGRSVAAFRAVMVVALIDVVLLVASGRVV